MRRGAVGLLLGIVVMLAGAQPASSASCFFGCKTPPTTKAPTPTTLPVAPRPAPTPTPAAFDPGVAAQHLLDLTNAERAAVGLPGLTMRADVVGIAQQQSAAMAAAGTIWHNEQFLTQEVRKALAANMLGENVGMGPTVDQVHTALMNSPGHRENILEPAFSIVGMAVAKSSTGMIYVTQDFVQPSGGTPRPVAKPAAAKPKVVRTAAVAKPRVASIPKPAAPTTTAAPSVTAAPATSTTTVAAQPDSSVLAAFDTAPVHTSSSSPAKSNGLAILVAFVLAAATWTGALRITRRA